MTMIQCASGEAPTVTAYPIQRSRHPPLLLRQADPFPPKCGPTFV
jgi:hypothetical protein